MKHFNQGNVWGRIAGFKEKETERKTPYLTLQIECSNELYGDVKAYGRLYGRDKIEALLTYHKKHPGAAYRFIGFFTQYDQSEGKRVSNYTFFNWLPFNGMEFRSAFILVGAVTAVENLGIEGKIYIHITRQGGEGYDDTEEDLEVYTLNAQEINGIQDGDIIQAKGMLRSREPSDVFGGSGGEIRPYSMQTEVRQNGEGPF